MPARKPPAKPRFTVLIVDDEPAIRRLVRAALEPSGYRILEARDGPEAIAAAGSQAPDLVLLDVGLPGMSGLDVKRWLRRTPAMARTPVLFLTGLGGAAGIPPESRIDKPFAPAKLLDRVSDALSRRALAS